MAEPDLENLAGTSLQLPSCSAQSASARRPSMWMSQQVNHGAQSNGHALSAIRTCMVPLAVKLAVQLSLYIDKTSMVLLTVRFRHVGQLCRAAV